MSDEDKRVILALRMALDAAHQEIDETIGLLHATQGDLDMLRDAAEREQCEWCRRGYVATEDDAHLITMTSGTIMKCRCRTPRLRAALIAVDSRHPAG